MDAAPFSGLVKDQQALVKVQLAIENAVAKSFQTERRRAIIISPHKPTQTETKRRANICVRIFRVLKGDLDWSWMRACDHLDIFLRKELDGVDWEPDTKRNGWMPASQIE